MREIKFRAWDNMYQKIVTFPSLAELFKNYETEYKRFELMQYTGLKDMDSTEIYEGDIVKEFHEGKFLKIKWDSHHVAFIASNRWCEWLRGYGNVGSNVCMNCKVVGNIYESSKTLEKVKDE